MIDFLPGGDTSADMATEITDTIPTFTTKRLILRAPSTDDIPSWQHNFNNWEVIRTLNAGVPWPYPADGVANFFREQVVSNQGKVSWLWVITRKEEPSEVIGVIELRQTGQRDDRGFWIAERFWGQGFVSEAVVPVTDHAFNVLGYEKLTLNNALNNVASRRVKEASNARFVGTEPAKYVDPTLDTREVWELTKDLWLNSRLKRQC